MEKDRKTIIEICDDMFDEAVRLKATDIHIEPYDSSLRIRFRILGELKIMREISREDKDEFIARLKVIAKLDVAEKRRPQDGRINLKIKEQNIDVRISILPLLRGEKIVLRMLNKNNFTFNINQLVRNEGELNLLKRVINKKNGLILISGPSGSGKTTTIYTILNKLKTEKNNIMTIEDPVEYIFNGINQSQTNYSVGYTFESGLNSILRQDPDIILVGELREESTTQLAIRAAETGHLVLSSIHTNDCTSAIFRLLGMNVKKHLLISALNAIISQRLVRVLCENCKEKIKMKKETKEKLGLDLNKEYEIYRSYGCDQCIDGYKERVAILEIVKVDQEIRRLLEKNPYIDEIREKLYEKHIKSLMESGIELLLEGKISLEEVEKLRI